MASIVGGINLELEEGFISPLLELQAVMPCFTRRFEREGEKGGVDILNMELIQLGSVISKSVDDELRKKRKRKNRKKEEEFK